VRGQPLLALQAPQRAYLVALHRVDTRRAVRPGGNVTGMTIRLETLSGKRLELLKQAFPAIASISVLMNPKNV
jgi:ABC-type uncharacterized transport system substrate-binding protein